MSDSAHELPELETCLSEPVAGLLLLRFQSDLVLTSLLGRLRSQLGTRQLHDVRFNPRTDSASGIAQRCESLADSTVPVLILRPEPGQVTDADLPTVTAFWKQLNAHREPLGELNAQLLLCLDTAQTPFAFSHAKDLISWCSPKFELMTLTETGGGEKATSHSEKSTTASGSFGASDLLTWNSLQPLWQQVMKSGKKPAADENTRLLVPLIRSAANLGMVTQGAHLIQQAGDPAFSNDGTRVLWLGACGDLAVAEGDLQGAMRRFTDSLQISERLAAIDPARADLQHALSVSYNKLGELALKQGDLPGAMQLFTNGLQIRARLAASEPANDTWQLALSVSHRLLGDLAEAQGDVPGAILHNTEYHRITERLAASDPENAEWQRQLSVSHGRLGDLAVKRGDLPGAIRRFVDSVQIFERLAASDPANAPLQRDLSISHNKLGDLAVAQGDLPGAMRRFTDSLSIRERLAASDSANAAWQRDIASSCYKIAQVLMKQSRWCDALPYMERNLAIAERLAASAPSNVMWQKDLTESRRMIADLRAKLTL